MRVCEWPAPRNCSGLGKRRLGFVRVADFNFSLPEELIAQTPPEVRGSSRMLVVDRSSGRFTDDRFANLPQHLRAGDLLILNDSRVLPARLFASRAGLTTQTGSQTPSGRIEVLLTQQHSEGAGARAGCWSALVRPGRKVQPGETLLFADDAGHVLLRAQVVEAGEYGERTLRFDAEPRFLEYLDRIGHMPLPPYIHREDVQSDRTRYQTVYAAQPGSSAAPTAGLHFTPEMLDRLRARGVELATVTLHVGLGTFQPVRVEALDEIRLHTEHFTVPGATLMAIRSAKRAGRRVLAAGTTTTRTLEHCASAGLLDAEQNGDLSGATDIFLRPGRKFQVIDGLLTNFHLPQSTLLMLVSAFLGADEGRQRALAAYAHAIEERYRFFSY
jgi:S-adenosylmethionine:tRNA ribosyltransferase-isomerase